MAGCWQQYGEVTALLVSKKKNGSAIVEFSTHDAAVRMHSRVIPLISRYDW